MSPAFDLIVVGGGPAGSSCARRAAELGLKTVVLERSTFPRPKPCAAGLSGKALALLDGDEAPIEHRRFRTTVISFGRDLSLMVESRDSLLVTTTRGELDGLLVRLAAAAGARMDFGRPVDAIDEGRDRVRVRAGADVLEASFAVVADGARGGGRAMLGLSPLTLGGGIYVRLRPGSEGGLEEHARTSLVDPVATRRGYGWIFPKRDHLNVGVFSQRGLSSGLKKDLSAFLELRGLSGWDAEGPFAFPIPVDRPDDALGTERVLFAGDAAGLVDPVTGEGISSAILSGRVAAEVVALAHDTARTHGPTRESAPGAYVRRVREEVLPMTDGSRRKGAVAYGLGLGFFRFVVRAPILRSLVRPAWQAASRGGGSLRFSVVERDSEGGVR